MSASGRLAAITTIRDRRRTRVMGCLCRGRSHHDTRTPEPARLVDCRPPVWQAARVPQEDRLAGLVS
ncbi:MAG: hypothetical protein LC808_10150, partial [Actinobacteria bacterium]|nr:hypothetical protein [Actinomycetota bacterium]